MFGLLYNSNNSNSSNNSNISHGGRGAAVAHWFVVPVVAGSNPVGHPLYKAPFLWGFFDTYEQNASLCYNIIYEKNIFISHCTSFFDYYWM